MRTGRLHVFAGVADADAAAEPSSSLDGKLVSPGPVTRADGDVETRPPKCLCSLPISGCQAVC